jgi:hypothetical protein
MDFKTGGSQSSITSIQGIGKDWGSLRQHDEPLYVKKFKEKRKDHREGQKHFDKSKKPVEQGPLEKDHDEIRDRNHYKDHDMSDSTGFEIVI